MNGGASRLFLFDIDGTLLTARGAGRAAMALALETTYGTSGAIDRYDFRGKTDLRAVFDILGEVGLPDTMIRGHLETCWERYVLELERLIGDGSRIEIMPGVVELVRALAQRDDAIVGLLTGNIEDGARVKLRPTGLLPFFRVGAFGSDDADRRRLPAIACHRTREIVGSDIPFPQVTIIGDTPLDIDCARSCGAVAVAVATGNHPIGELADADPDGLFADFTDVAAALAFFTAP